MCVLGDFIKSHNGTEDMNKYLSNLHFENESIHFSDIDGYVDFMSFFDSIDTTSTIKIHNSKHLFLIEVLNKIRFSNLSILTRIKSLVIIIFKLTSKIGFFDVLRVISQSKWNFVVSCNEK